MASGARGPKLPHDSRTRDRLREAQLRETQALAEVCRAQLSLSRVCAKREAALAAVEAAQAELVRVSGIERAALLLDADVPALRKVVNARNRREPEG